MKKLFTSLALGLVVMLAGDTPAQPLDKTEEAAAKKLFDAQAIGLRHFLRTGSPSKDVTIR